MGSIGGSSTAEALSVKHCVPPVLPARLPAPQVAVDHNAALHGIELEDIQLHRLSLMERGRVMRGMMRCLAGWAGPGLGGPELGLEMDGCHQAGRH